MQQQYTAYQRLFPNERLDQGTTQSKELNEFEKYNRLSGSNKGTKLQRYKKEEPLDEGVNIIHWWRDNR